VCPNCAIAKSKKKHFPKTSCSLATEKVARITIDILSVNKNSFGKNRFWLLIQDEFTGHILSEFITKKANYLKLCYIGSVRHRKKQKSR
jgi:hypothetical protein